MRWGRNEPGAKDLDRVWALNQEFCFLKFILKKRLNVYATIFMPGHSSQVHFIIILSRQDFNNPQKRTH